MSFEQIKAQVAAMPVNEQQRLMAYLVHLRHERDPEARKSITHGNDQHDPNKWLTLDELKAKWKE